MKPHPPLNLPGPNLPEVGPDPRREVIRQIKLCEDALLRARDDLGDPDWSEAPTPYVENQLRRAIEKLHTAWGIAHKVWLCQASRENVEAYNPDQYASE